ncbi:hypothetical protein AB1Y20_001112 [Prymnesium parvum]|uniref:Uncharacterized protein n=1 Tax=Prymnesium parvum TaxID=97485 RepID=A0AB34K7B2_PRYPA
MTPCTSPQALIVSKCLAPAQLERAAHSAAGSGTNSRSEGDPSRRGRGFAALRPRGAATWRCVAANCDGLGIGAPSRCARSSAAPAGGVSVGSARCCSARSMASSCAADKATVPTSASAGVATAAEERRSAAAVPASEATIACEPAFAVRSPRFCWRVSDRWKSAFVADAARHATE